MTQPRLPTCAQRAFLFRRQFCSWVRLLNLGQHLQQLLFEPGMQDRIGSREHSLGVHLARRRAKERQQFGGATALVLMGLCSGMPLRLAGGPRLGDGLIGSSFVFIELYDPICFCLLARQLDQSFFSGVSRS